MSTEVLPLAHLAVKRVAALDDFSSVASMWQTFWRKCGRAARHPTPAETVTCYGRLANATPHFLTLISDERLIGVVPLVAARVDAARVLQLLARGSDETFDALVEPGFEPAAGTAVFEFLAQRAAEWDCCEFSGLRAGSILLNPEVPLTWSDRMEPHDPSPVEAPRYRRILRHAAAA
ncbi:hypothetical protein K0B96_08455 [Horticoccus luteus]|uniref:Uncharacterized protein n=1 Tax=Horticoccus luteus TaxID=2862869 RepID=A0A8F9XLE4_9BACT|nr:hypothetical protein [Horticoccus luteus]QYM80618.1 hypothetical protein K0B96_08455 [Horticoccus luteus]